MKIDKVVLMATVAILGIATVACGPSASPDGQEGTAIQSHPYLRLPGRVPTGRIINFSDLITNSDGKQFRIRSIRLVSPTGPGIGTVKIRSLAPSHNNGGIFVYVQGDLTKCPRLYDYRVRPVNRIVEPPNASSDWRTLVSIIFTKPGRYHLYVLKVDYEEDGRRYWNYLRANLPIQAISPSADPETVIKRC